MRPNSASARGVCRWPLGQRRTHQTEGLPPGESDGFDGPHRSGASSDRRSDRTAAERINDERPGAAPAIEPDALGVRQRSRRRALRAERQSVREALTFSGEALFAVRAPLGRPSLWRPGDHARQRSSTSVCHVRESPAPTGPDERNGDGGATFRRQRRVARAGRFRPQLLVGEGVDRRTSLGNDQWRERALCSLEPWRCAQLREQGSGFL